MKPRCCYCGIIDQKYNMTPVPTLKQNREQWCQEFGLIFMIRCNSLEAPYVCKSHVKLDKNGKIATPMANQNLVYMDPELADHVYFKFYAQEEIEKAFDEPTIKIEEQGEEEEVTILEEVTVKPEEPCCSNENLDLSLDEDVMKYYLDVADDNLVDCGVCFLSFNRNYVKMEELRSHLLTYHKKELIDAINQTRVKVEDMEGEEDPMLCEPSTSSSSNTSRFVKNLEILTPEQVEACDNLLLQFIINNGVGFNVLEDKNLQRLVFNMNPNYRPPSEEGMRAIAKEIVGRKLRTTIRKYGPLTVTLDLCQENGKSFVAFTIVHFPYKGSHKTEQAVFFREITDTSDGIDVPLILRTIRGAVDESMLSQPFVNIVTSDVELEEEFGDLNCAKNVLLCFFTHLTQFAEGLIAIPVMSIALAKLRNFATKFQEDQFLVAKFKSFLIKRRLPYEFPTLDTDDWLTTVSFLTKSIKMHKSFHDFMAANKKNWYIWTDDQKNLVYLHTILTTVKNYVATLSTACATISQVIPTVIAIKNCIKNTTNQRSLQDAADEVFASHLSPFLESIDIYRFAVFLDPFQAFGPVYKEAGWTKVKQSVCSHLIFQVSGKSLISSSSDNFFKATTDIGREVELYCKVIQCHRAEENEPILAWWEDKEGRFPNLYKMAMEILAIPIFAIDAEQYFGENGQLRKFINESEQEEQQLMFDLAGEIAEYKCRGYSSKSKDHSSPKKVFNYVFKNELKAEAWELLKNNKNSILISHKPDKIAKPRCFKQKAPQPAAPIANTVFKMYQRLKPYRSAHGTIDSLKIPLLTEDETENVNSMNGEVKCEPMDTGVVVKKEENCMKSYTAEKTRNVTVVMETKNAKISYPWKNTQDVNSLKNFGAEEPKVLRKQYFVKGTGLGKFRHVAK